MDIDTRKRELRQQVKQEKKRVPIEQCLADAESLFAKLESMPEFIKADHVMCYWSLPDEVNTCNFIERWYQKKKIYLPKVVGSDLEIMLYSGRNSMVLGKFNIYEPCGDALHDLGILNMVIVPGVAFSEDGYRLGRGGGYYDRFLPKVKQAFKVGVAYPFQIKTYIPSEMHDIKMDRVVC
ncbi:5-formyltetrahydrofolate cyclo-ligase [Labilibacter sediminis]|nr:5-formyltetrahydrofolate cyclo-ligase [Labilibacter sediminis]